MKKLLLIIGVFALGTAQASEQYRCTVTAVEPATGTTASPTSGTCDWVRGSVVMVQCTAATRISASGTASADSLRIAVDTGYDVDLRTGELNISVLAVAAGVSTTCRFYSTTTR